MTHDASTLPEGWARATIADVALGRVQQTSPEAGFTYIDIGSIDSSTKRIVEPKRIEAGERVPSRARQRVRRGDVLVSMTRPNLNAVAQVPDELDGAICSTGLEVLRAVGVEPTWLFQVVQSTPFVDRMSSIVQGALYPAVRRADVRAFELPVPPVDEQRRIVERIEALQACSWAAREALAEAQPLLDKLRQSLLAAAFRGDLTAEWREQHPVVEPATTLLNRIREQRRAAWERSELAKFKDKGKKPPKGWRDRFQAKTELDLTFLPDLPDGWCYARADELVEPGTVITYGIVLPGPALDEGVPYIRGQDIEDGRILFDQLLRTDPVIHAKHARSEVAAGDVLLCIIRHLKVALVPENAPRVNLTQGTVRLRPSEVIDGPYLAHYLSSPAAQSWMTRLHFGMAMPRINVEDARAVPIPIAPIDEQRQIANLVDDALAEWHSIRASVADASDATVHLDQSILAQAFRGDLVPQNPDDEPASVLLERIRTQQQAQATAKENGKTVTRRRTTENAGDEADRSRHDSPLLDALVEADRPLSVDDLRAASGLSSKDFYSRLKDAVARGTIRELLNDGERYLASRG